MEKAMLIPARSLTRGWKLHAKHQLWHPRCLTLAVAGATEVKNAALSACRARVLVEQSYFQPFLPQSRARCCWNISCAEELGEFQVSPDFTVARGEMNSRMSSQENQGDGSCVPPSWQPDTAALSGTDAKRISTPIFPNKSMEMWCLGNCLVVDLGFDGLKGLCSPPT